MAINSFNINHLLVMSTCPDPASAQQIAETLVRERLAACVNRAPVHSVFRWKGEVAAEGEQLLVIKTTADRYDELELRLRALHPYKVPEIIALPIVAGAPGYLDWITDECRVEGQAESKEGS
jgi:periplasmic divalent cation tolerance protein